MWPGACGLAAAVVPALAADHAVTTSGNAFSPADVAVSPGDTVTIHNGGRGLHDLNWADGAPGQPVENTTDWSTRRTFGEADAGRSFVFFCAVHGTPSSGMRGTVHVAAPPPTTAGTAPAQTAPPPPPPPPSADSAAPRALAARATASRRGVRVRLTPSEPARVTVRVLRRRRPLARRTFSLATAEPVTLRVRRALRRGRHTVRLTLVDAAGNRSTRSLRARVR